MTNRPFDARVFDATLFDCNTATIKKTSGGWPRKPNGGGTWTPYVSKSA